MKVTVIKKDRLSDFYISKDGNTSTWITDFENGKKLNLLSVDNVNGELKLISNSSVYIIDSKETMVPNAILSNYSFYLIKNDLQNEKFYLYCSPEFDNTFMEYAINVPEIKVGSSDTSEIVFKMKGLPETICNITNENNHYYIEDVNNSSVYLNQVRIYGKTKLEYGDNIFIFGLRIILMRHDGVDYLLINNPNNLVIYNSLFTNVKNHPSSFEEKYEELPDDSLYANPDYFYRTPFFYKTIKTMQVNVDTPPTKKGDEGGKSAILTIGPMITMSMTSVVMMMNTINQMNQGNANKSGALGSIITCVAMLASSLLWPTITNIYQKRADKAYEKKRQKAYRKYIGKIEEDITREQEEQRQLLINNYYSTEQCINNIKEQNTKLWQKRLSDSDFLTLPVGYGNVPMDIVINYPTEHFSLEEDNLLDIAHELGKKERILEGVPITYSFFDSIATGIVGNRSLTKDFIDHIILQMIAQYSYDELKIAVLTSVDKENEWEYTKILPYIWNDNKNVRYFGSSNDDYREIIYNLDNIYSERKQGNANKCHYVIITDAIKSIDTYDFIKNVMKDGNEFGFSIIMLVDKITALPNECKNFINITNEECSIFRNELSENKLVFKPDPYPVEDLYECARILANVPIDLKVENETTFPSKYGFLEMYQVGRVEQLNCAERWRKSNPILSLQTPVGVGRSGELISLDLHEKYHGPHGLVAGTTGSGKSEFIISYVLSLTVNYSPNEVQVILIDYKGGSLAGAFTNDFYHLPHLAGTITNLDGNELNRSLASIESEVKRRQREFNEARNMTNESNVDIYKYQKLWREGKLKDKEPIAHLFIISDEFAELKEQQPEFMDKLISVARVGRSLGIHLILATQKPGGVVDSQIWSNTRFRVCLKVADTGDSQEVIKKPDAAFLKGAGRFYLQVGYDEVFTMGQAAWAGGQYYPRSSFKKEHDASVNEINNIGFVLTSKEMEKQETVESQGEELSNVVKYLEETAKKQNIKIRKLWLDKIPEKIYIDNLKKKYNLEKQNYYLNPIIGEYDDPDSQIQDVLTVPFSKNGNVVVYGMTGSGKENFIISLIYSLESTYAPQEVNVFILDFLSESLKMFKSSPYVGDVIYLSENEKVMNFFKYISNEVQNRKNTFASFGGQYTSYVKNNPDKAVPNIVVFINGFENFEENYMDLSDDFVQITREASKYGIYFVITALADNGVRTKVKQNFGLTYVLQQTNEFDYSSILGNTHGKFPSKCMGRGLFKKDKIYEFQTAMVTNENTAQYMAKHSAALAEKTQYRAKRVPMLPEVVDYEFIKDSITNSSKLVIGVNKKSLDIEKYDFKKSTINLVCSLDLENSLNFTKNLVKEAVYNQFFDTYLFNSSDYNMDGILPKEKYLTKRFGDGYKLIIDFINAEYDEFKKHEEDDTYLNTRPKKMFVFYGASAIINIMDNDTKKAFAEAMKKNGEMNLVSIVFVENVELLKNYAYEDWFKSGVDQTKGIWVGSGIAEQSLIRVARIEQEYRADISNDYGFVIVNSRVNCVKLLGNFETTGK